MINLDEAIAHCEEVAEKQVIIAKSNLIEIDKIKTDGILRLYDADEYESCMKCAAEHRQLAEWLKKLQAYEEAREKIEKIDTNYYKHCNGLDMTACAEDFKFEVLRIINECVKSEVNADENSN